MRTGALAAAAAEWRRRADSATSYEERSKALLFANVYEAANTYADAMKVLKVHAGVDPFDDDEDWATNTEWPWPPPSLKELN